MRDADVKKYITLTMRKRHHEEAAEELTQQIAELEGKLMASFIDRGVDRVSMDGHTVYLDRKLWAGAENGDSAATCAALEAAGLGDFVKPTFNVQQLSSWVRETERTVGRQDDLKALLPEALRPFIKVTEKYALRVRQAA
jgi:hypothetical protein